MGHVGKRVVPLLLWAVYVAAIFKTVAAKVPLILKAIVDAPL